MKVFKHKAKRFKIMLVAAVLGASSIVSIGFVDNHFEISKNLDIFTTLFRELNIYYVDETQPGDLMKTGIDAMLESLDPYTNYIPESDIEDYRFMTTGQYGGIGSLIRSRDEYIMVTDPYEGFPAHKAGLIPGDLILEVDGKSTEGKTTSQMSDVLKGQASTTVTLLIKREGVEKPFEKTLIREEIKIKDVPYYGMLNEDIGYIKLTGFTETAGKEVKDAFLDLKENNSMNGVVLDLRGNGGGLLREAVNIVNVFVDKGQDVVSTKGKVKDWDRTHKALNTPLDTEMPLTILINGGSASASEIVSGALQDLDRGVVVGNKSFGKGLVQQTRNLSYNAKLKLTVAKYYIPSGRCIQKLDYSHRTDEGRVEAIPDSLITEYRTKNGRTVKDGEGITPDIYVKQASAANISRSLVNKLHIFDFANKYKRENDKIVDADKFALADKEYDDFVKFLEGKEYEYTTRSEKLMEQLKETTEDEKYYNDLAKEYEALMKKMERNKSEDLANFKADIGELLENEIVSRYYYQSGRIQASLAKDPVVIKAIEVLHDKQIYGSVLNGSYQQPEDEKGN